MAGLIVVVDSEFNTLSRYRDGFAIFDATMAENLDGQDRIERIGEKGVGHRPVVPNAWISGTPENPSLLPTQTPGTHRTDGVADIPRPASGATSQASEPLNR